MIDGTKDYDTLCNNILPSSGSAHIQPTVCINWALSVKELKVSIQHQDQEADLEFILQEIFCEDGINQN